MLTPQQIENLLLCWRFRIQSLVREAEGLEDKVSASALSRAAKAAGMSQCLVELRELLQKSEGLHERRAN